MDLRNWLTKGVLITDGAWGTELQRLGLPAGTIPDTWNISHRERVAAVARSYVDAGSEVILTNTFRANAIAMEGASAAELDEINRAGVAISREAAGTGLVFASIGQRGRCSFQARSVRSRCLELSRRKLNRWRGRTPWSSRP
jgi:methionine synthase I (cobalamin-dependent)